MGTDLDDGFSPSRQKVSRVSQVFLGLYSACTHTSPHVSPAWPLVMLLAVWLFSGTRAAISRLIQISYWQVKDDLKLTGAEPHPAHHAVPSFLSEVLHSYLISTREQGVGPRALPDSALRVYIAWEEARQQWPLQLWVMSSALSRCQG